MAVTRLKRKAKRNKQTASIRKTTMKQIMAKPVIKNIDIEEVKAGFITASKTKVAPVKEKKEPVAKKNAPEKAEKVKQEQK